MSKTQSTARQKTATKRVGKLTTAITTKSSTRASVLVEQTQGWTFLTNHSHVLILLAQDQSVVLREVANRIGITERAVQRIIADLETGGFIEREKIGRQNHYKILIKKPLRHPIESHRTIGDLIELICEQ